jgi:hypothetical protein
MTRPCEVRSTSDTATPRLFIPRVSKIDSNPSGGNRDIDRSLFSLYAHPHAHSSRLVFLPLSSPLILDDPGTRVGLDNCRRIYRRGIRGAGPIQMCMESMVGTRLSTLHLFIEEGL